jgi:RNA polymerase sigma-70 factor (ECF subfamily)
MTFREVYNQHFRFVWRTLRALGVQERDTPDAVQEVFIVVHRKLPEFEARAKFTTWLFSICYRVARDRRRVAHVRRELPDQDTLDARVDEADSPARQAERRQELTLLERAFATLPDEQRAVFTLFEINGVGCEEIAETLGTPLGTVFSRLRLAREALRRAIARETASAPTARRLAPAGGPMSGPKRWLDAPEQIRPSERRLLALPALFEPPPTTQDAIWQALSARLAPPPDDAPPPGPRPADPPPTSHPPVATPLGASSASIAALGAPAFSIGKSAAIALSALTLAGGYGVYEGRRSTGLRAAPAPPSTALAGWQAPPGAPAEPATTAAIDTLPNAPPDAPARAEAPERRPLPAPLLAPGTRTRPASGLARAEGGPSALGAPAGAMAASLPLRSAGRNPLAVEPPSISSPAETPVVISLSAEAPPASAPLAAGAPSGPNVAGAPWSSPRSADVARPRSGASRLREEGASLEQARQAVQSGDARRGLALVEQARARFASEGALEQEWEALAVEALWRSGQRESAATRARVFLRAHPASMHAARLRTFASH